MVDALLMKCTVDQMIDGQTSQVFLVTAGGRVWRLPGPQGCGKEPAESLQARRSTESGRSGRFLEITA
jgi:hypothetical protein